MLHERSMFQGNNPGIKIIISCILCSAGAGKILITNLLMSKECKQFLE